VRRVTIANFQVDGLTEHARARDFVFMIISR